MTSLLFLGVWMRRVSPPNDRDGTLMEQSWIMNMNWTEIKAALGDCDSSCPPHPQTSWNIHVPSSSQRPTWPLGTVVSILAVSLTQPSRLSHTPISMTGEQDTHSHYNDQGCYLYSNEGWSESQADTSGSWRAQRGDPATVPAVPLQ